MHTGCRPNGPQLRYPGESLGERLSTGSVTPDAGRGRRGNNPDKGRLGNSLCYKGKIL